MQSLSGKASSLLAELAQARLIILVSVSRLAPRASKMMGRVVVHPPWIPMVLPPKCLRRRMTIANLFGAYRLGFVQPMTLIVLESGSFIAFLVLPFMLT
jgi:hypothetical protein